MRESKDDRKWGKTYDDNTCYRVARWDRCIMCTVLPEDFQIADQISLGPFVHATDLPDLGFDDLSPHGFLKNSKAFEHDRFPTAIFEQLENDRGYRCWVMFDQFAWSAPSSKADINFAEIVYALIKQRQDEIIDKQHFSQHADELEIRMLSIDARRPIKILFDIAVDKIRNHSPIQDVPHV
jgi:hypothetical protein